MKINPLQSTEAELLKQQALTKAFLFGKFLPFHKGHEALIRFALTQCDFLSVMVCASNNELIAGELRVEWIQKTFDQTPNLEITLFNYNEDELSNSSVSSDEVSQAWAKVFIKYYPNYQKVITSEPYGKYVAKAMGIESQLYDLDRRYLSITATAIRENLFKYRDMLPTAVKESFICTVVILGTESTGKTTLTQRLAEHYGATTVYEAGRELIADSTNFEFADLSLVADEHAKRILEAKRGKTPLIIVDTDIHITQSYAEFSFNKKLEVSSEIKRANHAQLYLYLDKDAPFVQDGTRMGKNDRDLLDASHRSILDKEGVSYNVISGDWEQRFREAVRLVDAGVGQFKNQHWRKP